MASLFGVTTAGTPQFERTEVAEETSPLMGAKSEHIRFGKLHIAMPVVGNRGLGSAPAAAERSGHMDTAPSPPRNCPDYLKKQLISAVISWLTRPEGLDLLLRPVSLRVDHILLDRLERLWNNLDLRLGLAWQQS